MIAIVAQILFSLVLVYWLSRAVVSGLAQFLPVKFLAFFLLPGTFLHEVGHLICAEFMMVRTDDLTLVPEIRADGSVKLGGVKIQQTDTVRRTIIGLAPVFFGLLIIWVATWFQNTPGVLYVYLLIQISLTMFSSAKDLEGAAVGMILIILILVGLRYLNEVVVWQPLLTAKMAVFVFLEHNLVYLRNGLVYCLAVNLALYIILTLWLRITGARKLAV